MKYTSNPNAVVLVAAYVAVAVMANVATTQWGLITAGFGLLVPAGTYCAGLALSLRDAVQEHAGARWVWCAIAAGTVLSAALADSHIALASGAAFAVSELLDLAVYSRLRAKGWRRALLISNAVGALVDTTLFLTLSGFGITGQALAGQLLVKAVWVSLTALALTEVIKRVVLHPALHSQGA